MYPVNFQYPRHPQTHNYAMSVSNKLRLKGRTEEETGSGLQDQLLLLPSLLRRSGDSEKPHNNTSSIQAGDEKWPCQQLHNRALRTV